MTHTLPDDDRAATLQVEPGESYRLIVLRRGGFELLIVGEAPVWTLPVVEVRRYGRVAEALISAIKSRYGVPIICLFATAILRGGGHRTGPLYYVVESNNADGGTVKGASWIDLESLSQGQLLNERDFSAITDALWQLRGYRSGASYGPFGRSGWMQELLPWVERQLVPLGLRLNGSFRQLNSGATVTLLRFETTGVAVWFKAGGKLNPSECSIAAALAWRLPQFVPRILGFHAESNGWLTLEAEGETLEKRGDSSAWQIAAQSLAALQIQSQVVTRDLLDAGCKDVRIPRLRRGIRPFLGAMQKLMDRQCAADVLPLTSREMSGLHDRLDNACSRLESLGIPDTIGHLDFNPGNIIVAGDHCRFLDWAEACVGHPFLTFEYLRSHFWRNEIAAPCGEADLLAAYYANWHSIMPGRAINEAQRIAPLIAVFAYAVTGFPWECPNDAVEASCAGYLRSLTRRMWHEAQLLN